MQCEEGQDQRLAEHPGVMIAVVALVVLPAMWRMPETTPGRGAK